MFNLEKRQPRGDVIALFKYLKGYHVQEEQDMFFLAPGYRAQNNNLNYRKTDMAEC